MDRGPDIPARDPVPVVEYRRPDTDPLPRVDLTNPMYPLGLAASAAVFGLRVHGGDARWTASVGLVIAMSWYVACRLCRDERIPARWRASLIAAGSGCVVCTAFASVGLQHRFAYWFAYGFSIPGAFLPVIVFLVAYVLLHATAKMDSSRT